jgi:hypothetical protein
MIVAMVLLPVKSEDFDESDFRCFATRELFQNDSLIAVSLAVI